MTDEQIDHTWPDPPLAALPAGLTELNRFSARGEGELIAPEAGEYELGLAVDDGFRLFLSGEKVFEDWTNGAERYRSVRPYAAPGREATGQDRVLSGHGQPGPSVRLAHPE